MDSKTASIRSGRERVSAGIASRLTPPRTIRRATHPLGSLTSRLIYFIIAPLGSRRRLLDTLVSGRDGYTTAHTSQRCVRRRTPRVQLHSSRTGEGSSEQI